ncbi:hypothetical protein K474DRAFT_1641867 [Panus rudis PR-1116 ss-1]|nr:hypothetical protein K474DRAFT_1641867 [Panus rudis PR-1116 ss-1]
MGGKAFNTHHPEAQFPRMIPSIYNDTKSKLHSILATLYTRVAVPPEAPEKVDHGDVDFIVLGPKENLTHEEVSQALGAHWSISGIPLSNYAIPFEEMGEEDSNAYIQVDVRVCEDEAEWDRVYFFSSYGDLGMILGLVARGVGLSYGSSGLRLANPVPIHPPNMVFYLTTSVPDILKFFGWSLDGWERGFTTQMECFEWVASSPYFDPSKMPACHAENGPSRQKTVAARGMYSAFLQFCREQTASQRLDGASYKRISQAEGVEAALRTFGKWELYCRMMHVEDVKKYVKRIFKGTLVTEWTGVKGTPVRWLMDEIQKRLEQSAPSEVRDNFIRTMEVDGVDPAYVTLELWQVVMREMDLEELRALTVQVKEEMDKEGRLFYDARAAIEARKQKKALRQAAVAAGAQTAV